MRIGEMIRRWAGYRIRFRDSHCPERRDRYVRGVRMWFLRLIACLVLCGFVSRGQSLAERLGYGPGDRLLIINGDDTGMCHTANLATTEAMEKGLLTGATIMVPCPWFPEIVDYAKAHPEKDFGIHLVQTSGGSVIGGAPWRRGSGSGLLDPDGYFWHETPQVYAKATPARR